MWGSNAKTLPFQDAFPKYKLKCSSCTAGYLKYKWDQTCESCGGICIQICRRVSCSNIPNVETGLCEEHVTNNLLDNFHNDGLEISYKGDVFYHYEKGGHRNLYIALAFTQHQNQLLRKEIESLRQEFQELRDMIEFHPENQKDHIEMMNKKYKNGVE